MAWHPKWKQKNSEISTKKKKKKKLQAKQGKQQQQQLPTRSTPKRPRRDATPRPDNAADLLGSSNLSLWHTFTAFSATSSPFVYYAQPTGDTLSSNSSLSAFSSSSSSATSSPPHPWSYIPPADFNYQYPDHAGRDVGEVAVLGRSNVGKSSLLNALMAGTHASSRKYDLARTSKQPGRTQQVSFYAQVSAARGDKIPPRGYLVDLPGYGFAVGPSEVVVDQWQVRTQEYLQERALSGHLRRLYLLLDCRRGIPDSHHQTPTHIVSDMDQDVLNWLDEFNEKYSWQNAKGQRQPVLPYTLVLTKADALSNPAAQLHPILNVLSLRYQRSLEDAIDQRRGPKERQRQLRHEANKSTDSTVDDPINNEQDDDVILPQSPWIHITSTKDRMGLQELWVSIQKDWDAPR